MKAADFELYRTYYPITKKFVYLNNASMQPLPLPVKRSIESFLSRWENGRLMAETNPDSSEGLRAKAAAFIGAKPSEIAFTLSTSDGVFRACYGIPFEPGDNIILPANEFPTNVIPWLELRARGVEVRMVAPHKGRSVTAYDLISATDNKTRLVAVSHVSFLTGYRVNLVKLGEFCRSRGIFSFVDAMQSAGAISLNTSSLPIDMMAFQGVKWIPAPTGAGMFYVHEPVLEKLKPNHSGWMSVQRSGLDDLLDFDLPLFPTARRFDGGSFAILSHAGLSAGLDLLNEIGMEQVETRNRELTTLLMEGLSELGIRTETPKDPRRRAGIVSFRIPHPGRLAAKLAEKGIVVAARADMLRVSPHFYNNETDIKTFLHALGRERTEDAG